MNVIVRVTITINNYNTNPGPLSSLQPWGRGRLRSILVSSCSSFGFLLPLSSFTPPSSSSSSLPFPSPTKLLTILSKSGPTETNTVTVGHLHNQCSAMLAVQLTHGIISCHTGITTYYGQHGPFLLLFQRVFSSEVGCSVEASDYGHTAASRNPESWSLTHSSCSPKLS